jgi:hypothetical protein
MIYRALHSPWRKIYRLAQDTACRLGGAFLPLTRSVGSMLGAEYSPLLFLMSNLPSAQITSTFLTEGESAHREQTEHSNTLVMECTLVRSDRNCDTLRYTAFFTPPPFISTHSQPCSEWQRIVPVRHHHIACHTGCPKVAHAFPRRTEHHTAGLYIV